MAISQDAEGYFQSSLSGDACNDAGEMIIKNWKKLSADITALKAATGLSLDTTNFDKRLSALDDSFQKAADTLDDAPIIERRTLSKDLTVLSGCTVFQRDMVIPDGIEVILESSGELVLL